ncbi:hypothetical protein yc1106_08634 [Curvularia clavata]|uniref:Up-regulated in Daf-2 domain-containing protein n=1 Tax=Curvularia clavata TaxID=95742 RepID=A0A9Q8ZFN9_CURCL|nr:hypothetical protein yc1106_08634 [Curvularia clavata]
MRLSGISKLLFFLCWLPLALCVKKREAYITIHNNTPDIITSASVSHKYSDNYKNQAEWENLRPGFKSHVIRRVEYNTGPLTLGRDWWFVTYHRKQAGSERPNQLLMWYSDPTNFRNIIDFLEDKAPLLIKTAIKAAKGSNPALLPAAKAAQIVSKAMCEVLFNTEKTDGFKQHILREEDVGEITTIVINADNTITFKSPSGNSETVTSTKWIDAEHA